jgi:hypothetical protein
VDAFRSHPRCPALTPTGSEISTGRSTEARGVNREGERMEAPGNGRNGGNGRAQKKP